MAVTTTSVAAIVLLVKVKLTSAAAASDADDSPRRIDLYVKAIASASAEPAAAGAEEARDADLAPSLFRPSVPREPPSCPNIHLPPASPPPRSVPQTGTP